MSIYETSGIVHLCMYYLLSFVQNFMNLRIRKRNFAFETKNNDCLFRYYACLCGHENLVEYLLQKGNYCCLILKCTITKMWLNNLSSVIVVAAENLG